MDNMTRITASNVHVSLSKTAAKEGMVLLKNENHVLPLSKGTRIALFGKATFDYVKGGGGSGDVMTSHVHNLYDGFVLTAGEEVIFQGTVDYYREYVQTQYNTGCVPGLTAEPSLPQKLVNEARAFTDTAVISISRFSGESWDRGSTFDEVKEIRDVELDLVRRMDELFEDGDFYFSRSERFMLEQISAVFPKTVVVLNVGGVIETAWLKECKAIDSVLLAWQGGMEGGLAAAELLMGQGNPSGKLADTFAERVTDYPGVKSFNESEAYVKYYEDIYVGYRYFETILDARDKVIYPFGYGLSYTDFELSKQKVYCSEDEIIASALVRNVGSVAGKEVVQIYFSAPQGKLGKPARVLAGYQKTELLAPGDEQVVRICFPIRQMASYDDLGKIQKAAWVLEKGDYRFYIGTSVRNAIVANEVWTLNSNCIIEQDVSRMVPSQLEKRLQADGSFELLPMTEQRDPDESALGRMSDGEKLSRRPSERDVFSYNCSGALPQFTDVAKGEMALGDFVSALPVEELVHLLGGQPNIGLADTFGFGNNKAFGIPSIMTADGPAGVRFAPKTGVTTTAFPCATLLACTWNPSICEAIGKAGAEEAKENGIDVWLTPGVCIHRNPLCGRNFEYYSEDPLLTGKQAAAMVRGIQSQKVAAVPKHFALNNKETNRKNSDSRASERAIREIYIKQFEIIVKEAKPWVLMSSYNLINGCRASENRDLLTGVLREEWGYQGMVTSDWWTLGEHYKELMAGNDIKMGAGFPERLIAAMEQGILSHETIETAARRVLALLLKVVEL